MYEAFVINLDRNPERLVFMRAQFHALGLDFTRVHAVDGVAATDRSGFQVAAYAPLSAGEIGCFESHRKAWQMIVDRDLPCGMVFEDDVAIAAELGALKFDDEVLQSADVIKIDTHPRASLLGALERELPVPGRKICRLLGSENSASGYVVTRHGAKRLLKMSENYVQPLDLFLFHDDYRAFIGNKIWKLIPAAVTQVKFSESGDKFHEEFRDGIQARRRANVEPRATQSGLAGLKLRLRRLFDGDTRAQRKRRHQTFLKNVVPLQETRFEAIPFHTESDAHTKSALSRLHSKPS